MGLFGGPEAIASTSTSMATLLYLSSPIPIQGTYCNDFSEYNDFFKGKLLIAADSRPSCQWGGYADIWSGTTANHLWCCGIP